jgi:N-methylhydantoinase B
MALRYKRASGFGVQGGGDGPTGGIWIFEPGEGHPAADEFRGSIPLAGVLDPETNAPSRGGRYVYPFRQPTYHSAAMSVLRYVNSGGGGWGDPFEREPERVMRDVRDGYVTIAGAARDYGVVVLGDPDEDPEGLVVDEEATRQLRTR